MSQPDLALLVVDFQERLMPSIERGDAVLRNARLLVEGARLLGWRVLATAQNPDKLGPFLPDFGLTATPKMRFSAGDVFDDLPENVVICGAETHVCVALTAIELLARDHSVAVVPDACGASTFEKHKLGMETIRDAGAMPMSTETLLYSGMDSCEHPQFRGILSLVKSSKQT